MDEKTAIQALDRKDRMLPLSPGRAESHGFEYKRNGTLSLFAALNTATGEVLGMTASRHTSAQFVAFLAEHPSVAIHYTPTYSSWLNQVESWFSRIQRDVIARGVFTTVKDLDRKLMRYIRQYNSNPKPLKWKYDNPNKRIRCNSSGSID